MSLKSVETSSSLSEQFEQEKNAPVRTLKNCSLIASPYTGEERTVTTEQIPQSGDYLRIFGRTEMTGGAMRIAMILAGHISFDGVYRGAPKGYAAFTMTELEDMAHMCGRSVRRALDELAALFGLSIHRRHHDRHLFQFTDICDVDTDAEFDEETRRKPSLTERVKAAVKPRQKRVTGHQSPASLYTRTKSNNHTPSMIKILEGAGSVHRTPFADVIDKAKKGTDAENMDAQFLWQGFHLLNGRNENTVAPLSWLIAFVRKAKPIYETKPKTPELPKKKTVCIDPVALMAKPARFDTRAFHERDLMKAIGAKAYEKRVTEIQQQYTASRFAAKLAVHGEAVREGIIFG